MQREPRVILDRPKREAVSVATHILRPPMGLRVPVETDGEGVGGEERRERHNRHIREHVPEVEREHELLSEVLAGRGMSQELAVGASGGREVSEAL